MAERVTSYYEKQTVIDSVAVQLKPVINQAAELFSGQQNPDVSMLDNSSSVFRKAHETLSEGLKSGRLTDDVYQRFIGGATFLGNWLAQPRTINEFQELKYAMLSWYNSRDELARCF